MKRTCTILALLCIAALPLLAVKAKPGVHLFTQPDGRVVRFVIRGDEFGHCMTSTDGKALVFDSGALCYASFDSDLRRRSTGIRLGDPLPTDLVSAVSDIPLAKIRAQAKRSRMIARPLSPEARSLSPASGIGTLRTLVIPVQFKDLSFAHTWDDFNNLLNQEGYSESGATGSVKDYLYSQFGDKGRFVFDTSPIVTLSKGYAWYGADDDNGNDLRPAEAVAEACLLLDPQVDFSQYDFIYLFYAGGNPADYGADDDHIWPHSWDLPSAGYNLKLDGRQIGSYSMSSELMNTSNGLVFTGIGTLCHEFSHLLGLMDSYDVDEEGSGGLADGMWGNISLMDKGNYNNDSRTPPVYTSFELEVLGLLETETLNPGMYPLDPLTSRQFALRMDGPLEGEYFLFECRSSEGWDRYIGGSGLLVYHIDKSDEDTGYSEDFEKNLTGAQRWSASYNQINCRPDHQCADLIETVENATQLSQAFFPYSSHNSLSSHILPAFKFWNGDECPLSLVGIKKSSGKVSFTVNGPISLDFNDVFQDAAIINWHTDVESCKKLPCEVSWDDGSRVCSETVESYGDGKYSLVLDDLLPSHSYELKICYIIDGEETYPFKISFTTSAYGGLPYIYISSSARRNSTFPLGNKVPLKVMNAPGATAVSWTYNGRPAVPGPDGYFDPSVSGLLKARVQYSDGTEDIIIRQINLK